MGGTSNDGGMAMKLYWRLKINGKWTWRPVVWLDHEKDSIKELIDTARIMRPDGDEDNAS